MSKCLGGGGFLRIFSVEKLSWMRIVQRIAHTKFKLLIIIGCKLCTNSYSQSLFSGSRTVWSCGLFSTERIPKTKNKKKFDIVYILSKKGLATLFFQFYI